MMELTKDFHRVAVYFTTTEVETYAQVPPKAYLDSTPKDGEYRVIDAGSVVFSSPDYYEAKRKAQELGIKTERLGEEVFIDLEGETPPK